MNIFKTNLVVVFLLHSHILMEYLCLEGCSGPAYHLVCCLLGKMVFSYCSTIQQFLSALIQIKFTGCFNIDSLVME